MGRSVKDQSPFGSIFDAGLYLENLGKFLRLSTPSTLDTTENGKLILDGEEYRYPSFEEIKAIIDRQNEQRRNKYGRI